MYKEVAIDPRCMADMEYYNLVKQHFGYDKGRYISAEVKVWTKEAMEYVKKSDLSDVKLQSVKNYLNKIGRSKGSNEFLLTKDRKGSVATCWNDWVDKQKTIRVFSCIISKAEGVDKINIDDINEGCSLWDIPASTSIKKNPHDIISVLQPLIKLSQELVLIDPFFTLSRNPVLEELFKEIQNTFLTSLRIVTSIDSTDVKRIYNSEYEKLNTKKIAFQWIKVPEKFFHDRYFISNVGALGAGQGFLKQIEKGAPSDLLNLHRISHDEASGILGALDKSIETEKTIIQLTV